jgi:hypothetical protein
VNEEEARRLGAAQDELRDDPRLLEAYGEGIPEVWTGIRFDGPRLVALLTAPDLHRDQILALVAHPDHVDVRSAPHSRKELDEVHEQLLSLIGPDPQSWTSHSPGLERVQVTLRVNENALASQLHQRFPDALEIQLGHHPYPLSSVRPDAARAPQATIELPYLHLSTEPERETWHPGETIGGLLRLTNVSTTETLRLDTGSPTTGVLLDEKGVQIVGGYTGWIAEVGRGIELGPGSHATIEFLAGSDTLDPSAGAVLPPGNYLLVVQLHLSSSAGDGQLVAPSIPVRLEQP